MLNSPAYIERLMHPTRWTQRMMPMFRAMARTPGTVTLDRGRGLGGAMTWIVSFGSGSDASTARSALAQCCDDGASDAGIVRMQL